MNRRSTLAVVGRPLVGKENQRICGVGLPAARQSTCRPVRSKNLNKLGKSGIIWGGECESLKRLFLSNGDDDERVGFE